MSLDGQGARPIPERSGQRPRSRRAAAPPGAAALRLRRSPLRSERLRSGTACLPIHKHASGGSKATPCGRAAGHHAAPRCAVLSPLSLRQGRGVRAQGGSASESNRPGTLRAPHNGFEDRGGHRAPSTPTGYSIHALGQSVKSDILVCIRNSPFGTGQGHRPVVSSRRNVERPPNLPRRGPVVGNLEQSRQWSCSCDTPPIYPSFRTAVRQRRPSPDREETTRPGTPISRPHRGPRCRSTFASTAPASQARPPSVHIAPRHGCPRNDGESRRRAVREATGGGDV